MKRAANQCARILAAGLLLSACLGMDSSDSSSEGPPAGVRTFSGTLKKQGNGFTSDHVLLQFSCTIHYTTSLQAAEEIRMRSVAQIFEVTTAPVLSTFTRAELQTNDAVLGEAMADFMLEFAGRAGPNMPWFKFDVACTDLKAL